MLFINGGLTIFPFNFFPLISILIDLYNGFNQEVFDLAIYDAQGVTRYAMQIYFIIMNLYIRQHQ